MALSDQKAFMYASFISYIIHAVGSAILSSSAGVIGFIALAIVAGEQPEEAEANLILSKQAGKDNCLRTN